MLLKVLLFNSEAWLRITKKDLEKLEGIDRVFMRRIFQVPNSVPSSFLYLETGCVPIRYVMKTKRIMFLHHILTREENALISQDFWVGPSEPASQR